MDNLPKKAIFFDWGRTLYDPETEELFDGVPNLLEELSKKYLLVVISLAANEPVEARRARVENSGVMRKFKLISIGAEDKDEMYEKALSDLGITARDVVVVDDRVVRGIAWGNQHGAQTIWVKKGKFSGEVPTQETGEPNFIVTDIKNIKELL